MKSLKLGIVLLLSSVFISLKAENPTASRDRVAISGIVKDGLTGEDLIGATIYVQEVKTGTVSNVYGFYSISLNPGVYTITYSYLGYESVVKAMDLNSDKTVNLSLEPSSEKIEEVIVTSKRPDANITSTQMGVEKLQSKTIKSVPVLMGEVDPIKVIQMLPGVKPTSEGSSGFSVRGGSPDQNLILLDEAIVYNAGHLMGFFSVFNNDAIKDIQLYKGDFPSSNGGRLASLLDVRMKDGNNHKISGNGGVGLISSRLTLEGPIGSEKTSFLVSGRRTYMDIFLPLFADKSARNNQIYFYDFNAKVNHTINENNRIFLSGYLGRDIFKGNGNVFAFGNQTFTARWNHVFNPRLFSNFTLIQSNYNYELGVNSTGGSGFNWNSQLTDYSLKLDFNYYMNPHNTITFGAQSIYHRINPGYAQGTGDETLYDEIRMPYSRAIESSAYISNKQKISDDFSLRYGFRLSAFTNVGKTTAYEFDENYDVISEDGITYDAWEDYNTYVNIEPRLALNYRLSSSSSFKGSYSRTVQYMQMASNSTSGSPLDVWFPASPNIKPQIADQFSVGYFRNFKNNTIETSVELFYKDMSSVIDFRDHARLLLNKYLEGEMRSGQGYAYGAEFLMRLNLEKYSGWISYTYSRAFRQIDGINENREYRSPYDRPHDISVVLSRKFSKRVSLSVNWVYLTGMPYTAPAQRMMVGNTIYEKPDGSLGAIPGSIVPIYSDRNMERMPDYHRLDVGLTLKSKYKEGRWYQGEWNFSVYNAYARHNAWMIGFEQDEDDPLGLRTNSTLTYLFSIIPSVSYNFKF